MTTTKLTQYQAQVASLIQSIRQQPGIPTAWLPISYVMAHVEIESGFDPAIQARDFATTGSVGLMQVRASTAEGVYKMYPTLDWSKGQADARTSLLTGMLYLRICRNAVLPTFGNPLLYRHVCMAYNEGPGNVIDGRDDSAYWFKWLSAQPRYAALDSHLITAVA